MSATPSSAGEGVLWPRPPRQRSTVYPWIVFGLTLGLLLADYMSRQVVSAVYPFLKAEWAVSDSQLASLTSVVALVSGLLALPLAIVADRVGRVRAITVMAGVWSLATLMCAFAAGYGHMFAARMLVGVGEAAYGSVGIAVVLSVFRQRMHATLSGAFMAGGSFGTVIGVAFGGYVAMQFHWRWSFVAAAAFGLVMIVVFAVVVTERRIRERADAVRTVDAATALDGNYRAPLATLFTVPSVVFAYLGGGMQMLNAAVLLTWTPSFFNRYYDMAPDSAGSAAAGVVLLVGSGMIICGIITDRISRHDLSRRWGAAIAYCAIAFTFLSVGYRLDPGAAQIAMVAIGAFFSAGSTGTIAAMVANLSHPSVRGSAMGSLTVANNLVGLALGPMVVGFIADRAGLVEGLGLVTFFYPAAIVMLFLGRKYYSRSISKIENLEPPEPAGPRGLQKESE